MAGDLVTARGNVFDQLRMPFGHPSQHEKSPADIKLREDIEQFLSVSDHARLTRAPAITLYVWRERRNVKVVLYVNGQCVRHFHDRVTVDMIGCDGKLPFYPCAIPF